MFVDMNLYTQQGLVLLKGINLNPRLDNNHIHNKVWDTEPLKFGDG